MEYIDGSVQDCGISTALAMEILQSCTKPYLYEANYVDKFDPISMQIAICSLVSHDIAFTSKEASYD